MTPSSETNSVTTILLISLSCSYWLAGPTPGPSPATRTHRAQIDTPAVIWCCRRRGRGLHHDRRDALSAGTHDQLRVRDRPAAAISLHAAGLADLSLRL